MSQTDCFLSFLSFYMYFCLDVVSLRPISRDGMLDVIGTVSL